jgi:hypothetical protein
MKGQAIVEFALVFPLLLFVILGGIEAGFLIIAKADQDRATQVIVDWAALHPAESWNSVANHELPGCTVIVSSPFRDVLEAASQCQYHSKILVDLYNIPIGSHQTAAKKLSSDPEETPVATPLSS